jgi:hypothetical protein
MCLIIVKVVCDLVKGTFKWVPIHILRKVDDCLCGKKVISLDV